MSSEAGTVLHAYGVIPAGTAVDLPRAGIGGARVETTEVDRLAALVSRLDAARYGEEVWREHGEDPRWLAEFATQHQDVLGAVVATCDVLPFRIPGMYADEARLREVLTSEHDLLSGGLDAVSGHVEWGIHVFLTSDQPAQEQAQRPSSGADYLRSRSEQLGSRERVADQRRAQVLDAYGSIAEASTHSVANPPQDSALTKRSEPMLLNSAHLVLRDREEPFFAVLGEVQQQLQGAGMVVEVSGPWPPYNFVHLASEEQRA